MKLSNKLIGAFGILLLLLTALGIFSLSRMADINKASSDMATNWLPTIVAVGKLNSAVNTFRRFELVHILSTDEAEMRRYEQQMLAQKAEVMKYMKEYEPLVTEPAEKENYPKVQKAWNEFLVVHDKVQALSSKNQNVEAAALAVGDGARLMQEMIKYLSIIVDVNNEGGKKSADLSLQAYTSAKTMVIIGIVVSLLIGAALAVLLIRNVLAQLGEDPGYLEEVSKGIAAGNLDMKLKPVAGAGGVYGVMVQMVANLKAKIAEADTKSADAASQAQAAKEATAAAEEAKFKAESAKAEGMLAAAQRLEDVVAIVSSASEELSSQIEETSRGTEQQANRIGETATAMEEMNATVLEVARNSSQAAQAAETAKNKTEEGARLVDEVVRKIQDVNTGAQELKADMDNLGRQAAGIGQILNVISDIADQTNLLALNAAIEAARAGDAGRGFAVVADEVRKLAEKTQTATKEVGDAIRNIQEGARKNIANVDRSVITIEEANTLSAASGQALSEIVKLIDQATDQVRSIATASEQQSASSEEINRSIEEVNTIAAESSQGMNQAAQAVSEMAQQAQALRSLIEEMSAEGGGQTRTTKHLPTGRSRKALGA